jgi:hypothetical protein
MSLVISSAELTGGGIHDTNRKPCNNNGMDDGVATTVAGASTDNSSRLNGSASDGSDDDNSTSRTY